MARLSYAAPGVYVEEIPSAQQPIAGVGTNTVGFIGVIPDEIQYPVHNPDYDPVLAQLVLKVNDLKAKGAEVSADDSKSLEQKLKNIDDGIAKLTADIEAKVKDKKDDEDKLQGLEEEIANLEGKPVEERTDDDKKALRSKNAEKTKLTKEIGQWGDEIEAWTKQKENLEGTKKDLSEAPSDQKTDKIPAVSAMKPYILKKFQVKAKPGETRLCTNFSEYRELFGPFSAYREDEPDKPIDPMHSALTNAVYGFFLNGGTRCFVARVTDVADIADAMDKFESIEAVAIVAAPGFSDPGIWSILTAHCEQCEDRFAILDCPETVGSDDAPDLQLLGYDKVDNVLPQRNKNAAFYFPWIEISDPAKLLQDEDPVRKVPLKYRGRVHVPPSGHVAGIYARTDEQRGVHKAPANAPVAGALNVKYYISKAKQELLNPQGVNVIRNMNGDITVWGARTIGGDMNSEWKYINVRRVFLFLRDSIDQGTQWVVFEPNDRELWGKIRRNVSDFLRIVWRSGALFGSSPEEAFYVKCDDETNPPEVRELGQVITEIGVAIVRPAEFVIFRITQSSGPKTS